MTIYEVNTTGLADYDDEAQTLTFYAVPRMPDDYPDPIEWYYEPQAHLALRIVVAVSSATIEAAPEPAVPSDEPPVESPAPGDVTPPAD